MEYENEIFGCAFCCPVIERLVDCPFNEIDHLSIEEKVNWIRALSAERSRLFNIIFFAPETENRNRI